jgi:hypothetical protein
MRPSIQLTRISSIDFSTDDKKCEICGAKSNKGNSLQFGVESCGGCGSFFRRVVTKVYKLYGCVANGNCVINEKTRNSCKQCRFDKCLEKGMDQNKVLFVKAKSLKTTVKSLKRKKNGNLSQDIEENAGNYYFVSSFLFFNLIYCLLNDFFLNFQNLLRTQKFLNPMFA